MAMNGMFASRYLVAMAGRDQLVGLELDHQVHLLFDQVVGAAQRDLRLVAVVHHDQFHVLALGGAHQAIAHFAVERGVLPLRRIADAVEPPPPDFARQPVVIFADLIQETALVERVEQAEAHALVEAGARHHIAQSQHVAGRLKCLQHARSMHQALDQIPVVIGSLNVDPVCHSVLIHETRMFRRCRFPGSRNPAITAVFIAEYTICSRLADVPHREKPPCSGDLSSRARVAPRTIGVCTPIRKYDTESPSGRNLSLAGRPGIRQFLCSLPRRQALVLGDLLADRRLLQLDHRPGHAGADPDQRPARACCAKRRAPRSSGATSGA